MVFMAEGGFDIANWPHLEAWAGRLKAMPGFALPNDLIPSKDRELESLREIGCRGLAGGGNWIRTLGPRKRRSR
jgi:hypothetical protein